MATFVEKLRHQWQQGRFVCVGLDTDYQLIPECLRQGGTFGPMNRFNCDIVDATADQVCGYKINLAFYEREGVSGLQVIERTVSHIRRVSPEAIVILDAKRGDIGNTNLGYAQSLLGQLDADAITIHPYMGQQANQPFLDWAGKGIFVLCKTSNQGSGEFQDRLVFLTPQERKRWQVKQTTIGGYQPIKMYELVAHQVSERWNQHGNCAVVVGATYPAELAQVRQIVGSLPILIPGVGAQGGDLNAILAAGLDSDLQGVIINCSRSVIYASSGPDFAEAAGREVHRLNWHIVRIRNRLRRERTMTKT